MTRKMLRMVIVMATLSLTGIFATQLFWLMRAFDHSEQQFTHNVNLALQNVVESLCNYNSTDYPGANPVEQLASNYFIVRTNNMIDPKVLAYFLTAELGKRQIDTPFEYTIYDCQHEKLVFGGEVNMPEAAADKLPKRIFPALGPDNYFFGVYFPEKPAFIAGQMSIWLFSTLVLIIVVIYFTYTLYVILKQRRLSEIQKDFINNMTHELRTPLATIAISAEVLRSADIANQPDRLRGYAQIIENESRKLKNQVERVLEMVSIEKEEISLRSEDLDMHQLILAAIEGLKPQLEACAGNITTHFCSETYTVMGDSLHMGNVFFNLIDNAIKYSGGNPEIYVHTRLMGNKVHIAVQDQGIGIGPDDQNRIFTRFYRVPTGNVHNTKGFGIGLNYVKIITEAHSGTISLTSTPRLGSTFTLTFPICQPQ